MRRTIWSAALMAALTLAWAAPAHATPVAIDNTWHEFGFGGPGSMAFQCPGCTDTTDPLADKTAAPPYTFTGSAVLTVLDLFIAGDTFNVFDNNVLIGMTNPVPPDGSPCDNDIGCAEGNAAYSRLVANLGPGAHSITIQAAASPFGGGAAVFQVATPEPTSLLLLGTGLAFAGRRYRLRRK